MSLRAEPLNLDALMVLLKKNGTNELCSDDVDVLKKNRISWAIYDDERPVMCGGITQYWQGRGEAWAVFDPDCRKQFLGIHKITKRLLLESGVKRIEASVKIGFDHGHRWIKALGFKLDAELLKSYLPDGSDVSLYSMVGGAV